jgi:tetratricopeptide (TPR) repeat protein
MSEHSTGTHCPDAETLAAFAEGRLARHEIPAIAQHLETCRSCRFALEAVNETVADKRPFRTMVWLAAAAVIAIAFLAIPQLRSLVQFRSESPMTRLVELAPKSARLNEARLSAGVPWAAYRGPERAAESTSGAERLKLGGAVGEIVERADSEKSGELQHAAGVGLVMIEMPLDAIARLRAATELDPKNARVRSDLAAAQYAAALRLDRPSLYPEALASADAALRVDAKLPEALFNRALILERLGLTTEARQAWSAYLSVDPASPWAIEARERLRALPASTSEERFKKEMPQLERAVTNGDPATVAEIVDRHRQLSRTTAETLTLGEWGRSGNAQLLEVARGIGVALQRNSGEALLRDAVTAIDSANAQQRAALAEAHAAYLRGRLAYSRNEPAAAEPDLRRAAALFAANGSPLSGVARYFAACVRFDQNDLETAHAELTALLAEVDRQPSHAALGAQVRWQLALCAMSDDDWQGALPLLTSARDAFVRLGERSNGGFLDALLADAHAALGRADDSWQARIRSFAVLSTEGRPTRMPVSLGAAARMELRAGRLEEARSMLEIEESMNRAADNAVLLANTLVREAALSARIGDNAIALRKANEAVSVARNISDAALRTRAMIDADFAMGVAMLSTDPERARTHLTKSIEGYQSIERALFLPEPYLLRARAALAMGAQDEALRDVERGVAELERHRIHFAESVTGLGIFDAGRELYQIAIRMSADRDDAAAAFAYAERSRAHIVASGAQPQMISAGELQKRLAGSGAAVLELVALDDEVLAICITEHRLALSRHRVARSRLAEITNAEELYDLLIRPSEANFAQARQLIIVADSLIDNVPFAALRDARANRYLVERVPVALAPSASSLRVDRDRASRQSVVAVALPSGVRKNSVALPQTHRELSEIAKLYRESIELDANAATFPAFQDRAAHADVIHISGHTERQAGAGDSALVFTNERVSWKSVAATPLPSRPVVVLAACETLRRPRSPQTFALSLGGGFLAAGASDVIGTLTPVADNEARAFFGMVHRQLQGSGDAAAALRRAQIEALSAENAHGSRLPWRAVALLTNRIPRRQS